MDSLSNLSFSSTAVVSAATGFSVRLLVNPLDVIKIRWQLQVEPISTVAFGSGKDPKSTTKCSSSSKYQTWAQTLTSITKEEGVKGFWKGHLSGQILAVGYTTIQFTAFGVLSWLTDYKKTFWVHFMTGGISGVIATIGTLPIDIVRTRLVAQGTTGGYSSLSHAFRSIQGQDGLSGFYRGWRPAVIQIFPLIGLNFGLYHVVREPMQRVVNNFQVANFLSGALTGLAVKLALHPFDVFKKRLMVQGFEDARVEFGRFVVYRGLWDCFKTMYFEEGICGIFKGASPNVAKGAMASGLQFGFFELYIKLLQNI